MPVDRYLRVDAIEGMWAAGDAAAVPDQTTGSSRPRRRSTASVRASASPPTSRPSSPPDRSSRSSTRPSAVSARSPLQGRGERQGRPGSSVVPPSLVPPARDAHVDAAGEDRDGLDGGAAVPRPGSARRSRIRENRSSEPRIRPRRRACAGADSRPGAPHGARDVRHLVTPESSSAAHRVISRIDTIPTTLPPSTIGRWRMFFDTICSAASDSSVFEPTVIRSRRVMPCSTVVVCGSPPAATRFTMSRSVTMPASCFIEHDDR